MSKMPPPLLFSSTMTMLGPVPGAALPGAASAAAPGVAAPAASRDAASDEAKAHAVSRCTRNSRWRASAFKSCSSVRSPVTNVVWEKCCAAPSAVDTVPSMPLRPRLQSTARRFPPLT